MKHFASWTLPLAVLAGASMLPTPAVAQQAGGTVTTPVTTQYDRGPIGRAIWGANWRDLWSTPVTAPVLNLDTLGGLTPDRTGGRQSKTLHFEAGNGRVYIFRSTNKFLHRAALPPDLRNAPVGDVVQDQISMLFPNPGLIVTRFERPLNLLNAIPRLVVMPDDPRLGEFREEYAGLVGVFEENPQEGEDDTPGFAESTKVVGADNFIRRIEESGEHKLVAQEYLMARLVDFLINDTDRGSDNWKFARFPDGEDDYWWRVIPRDRDFGFTDPGGLFGAVSRAAYPKLAQFEASWPNLRTLTFMSRDMDRRFLAPLSREQWDSVVYMFRAQLTDDVLRSALAQMPDEYEPQVLDEMLRVLQWRRDRIAEPANEFFAMVNRDADVIGSNDAESAEALRIPDGSVRIRLFTDRDAAAPDGPERTPYFDRTFLPSQTREVRLYMQGGDDQVFVRNLANGTTSSIEGVRLRIIGGEGDDVLVDQATGGRTLIYAQDAGDRVTSGARTEVRRKPFDDPFPGRPMDLKGVDLEADEDEGTEAEQVAEQDVGEKLAGEAYRDFGSISGFGPRLDHRSGVGIIVGGGWSKTRYGFRRVPHMYAMSVDALYGIESGGFGVELELDYHPENSRLGLGLEAHASQFESFRWFGFGNDAPDVDQARVYRDEVMVRPLAYWTLGNGAIGIGPVFKHGDPRADEETPFREFQPYGATAFSQAGVSVEGHLGEGHRTMMPWRGLTLVAGGAWYPELLDVEEPFGRAYAQARYHLPIGRPVLALRAGAQRVWGRFPVHEAAFLGGRSSLRGYETQRYAGDASVFGGTELHIPLGEVTLLTHTRVGVFGLADAGRVYLDGESPGNWHSSYGGGLTLETLGRVLTLTYAQGETGRFYVELGLPF